MTFSDVNSNRYNDINKEVFGNRIIILKRVKSLKQLRRTEKEFVRLNYKEAVIKGFTLKGIQQYIATKTKIWIEWSCLEYLKKAEEQENREWYCHMARDHFAYVGSIQKMHRRDRAAKKGDVEYHHGLKGRNVQQDSGHQGTAQPVKDVCSSC